MKSYLKIEVTADRVNAHLYDCNGKIYRATWASTENGSKEIEDEIKQISDKLSTHLFGHDIFDVMDEMSIIDDIQNQ